MKSSARVTSASWRFLRFEHLAHDREVPAGLLADVAEVKERHERLRVCALGVERVGVAEDDDVVERRNIEAVDQVAIRRVAVRERHRLVGGLRELERVDVRDDARLRPRRDVAVELGDDVGAAPVPAEDERALRRGGRRLAQRDDVLEDRVVGVAREDDRGVILGDDDDFIASAYRRVPSAG